MENPHKRIVFDIDDTISFTTSRNWSNAKPNIPLIQKINNLYDDGWEIYLVTARGSISCETREKAAEKYEAQIKKWLNDNNVKYHVLSFDKFLAAYYVDDKAITPEDFLNLKFKVIKSGWSGATVELRDNKIYKTHNNSRDVAKWYNVAKNYINVPKVHSLVGDTLCLQYLNNNSDYKINDVIDIINIFRLMEPAQKISSFKNYLKRIENHAKLNNEINQKFEKVISILNKMFIYDDNYKDLFTFIYNHIADTFCHGDLSIDNIITQNNETYLIDPIFEENNELGYSSWLLDVSKLMMSLYKNKDLYNYNYVMNYFVDVLIKNYKLNTIESAKILLNFFVFSQFIRIYKYIPTEKEKEEVLKIILYFQIY